MYHQKPLTFDDIFSAKNRLKNKDLLQEWLKNFGLFDMEINRYMKDQSTTLASGAISHAANRVKINEVANLVIGKEYNEYTLGFNKHSSLFYSGLQMGAPGLARLVLECIDKNIPAPVPMAMLAVANDPNGIRFSEYNIRVYEDRFEEMKRRKLIKVEDRKVYPTPITAHIFSEDMIDSFERLKKWEHKNKVMREFTQ